MVELTGKYNSCKIFTDNVDETTISQINTLLDQEFIKDNKIRIMPDTHAGEGCVIGTTMTITDKIVPNLVGVDVGCGMHVVQIKEKDIDLDKLDNIIRTYVKYGFDIWDNPYSIDEELNDIIAPIDIDRANRSICSLGSGNHFIEVDKDSNGNIYLVIHTGSRHLGIEICKYYQKLAYTKLKKNNNKKQIAEIIERLKAENRQSEIESTIKELVKNTPIIPENLCYVENEDFDNYIHDMRIAQHFAVINRQAIANNIIKYMNWYIVSEFETIHNYIDCDNMILRKGSVSAKLGEKLIIPINMRDGSLICIGKGNPDWNYSAPHGAGRIMSRSQARQNVSMEEYTDSMKDIYSTCISEATIDESPMVYKPIDEIKSNIKDTVDIIDTIKPIYNFKAN